MTTFASLLSMSENVSASRHVFERSTQENTLNFTMPKVVTSSEVEESGGWTLDRTPWIPALVMAVAMLIFLSLSFYNHHKRVRRKKEIIMDYLTTLLYSDVWSRGRSVSILCHTNSISFDELGRSFKIKSKEEKEPQDIMRERYIKDLVATITRNTKSSLKRIVSAPSEYRFNRISGPITADKKAFSMSLMDHQVSVDAGQLVPSDFRSVTQGSPEFKGSVSNGILLNPKARFYNPKYSPSFHDISSGDDLDNLEARGETTNQPWQPKGSNCRRTMDDTILHEERYADKPPSRVSAVETQRVRKSGSLHESQRTVESCYGKLLRAKASRTNSLYEISSDDPKSFCTSMCPQDVSGVHTTVFSLADCHSNALHLDSSGEVRETYSRNTNSLPFANYRQIQTLTNVKSSLAGEGKDKDGRTLVALSLSPTEVSHLPKSRSPLCVIDNDQNTKVSFWVHADHVSSNSCDDVSDVSEELYTPFPSHSSGSIESSSDETRLAASRSDDRLDKLVYNHQRNPIDLNVMRHSSKTDYNPMLPAEIQAVPSSSSLQVFLPVVLSGQPPVSTPVGARLHVAKYLKTRSGLARSVQACRKDDARSSGQDSKDNNPKLRSILKKTLSTQSTTALLLDGNMATSEWRSHDYGPEGDECVGAQDRVDSMTQQWTWDERHSTERQGAEQSAIANSLPRRSGPKGVREMSFPETSTNLWDMSGSTGSLGPESTRSWSGEGSVTDGLATTLSLEALPTQDSSRFGSNLHRLPRFQVRSGMQQRLKLSSSNEHIQG